MKEVLPLAGKSIKVKEYLEQNRNRNILEVANEALLKIFGDEDTYLRYVLVNFNRNIDRTFGATRKDGVYVSNETALRNFNGDYKDFAECHGAYKLGYNVISSAFDDFYRLELEAFCCGVVDTNSRIAKKSYSSRYSMDYSVVNTPAVIEPNKGHPNYQILQDIGFDRKNMTPYIYMDTATLCAFVQFRAMVYEKYRDNLEEGFLDRSRAISKYGFPNMNKNEYVAYALAIKDTCEFFRKFYSPDRVQFATTKLPFSLAVLNQKVAELRNSTNIMTIGTLSHFSSAKRLPMLDPSRYSVHALCNTMAKIVTLGGKYVSRDEYMLALNGNKDIIAPRKDITFDGRGIYTGITTIPTPAPVAEIKRDIDTSTKIGEILETTTSTIKGELQFTPIKGLDEKKSYIEKTTRVADKVRNNAYFAHYVVDSLVKDVREYQSGKKSQIPMFFEYSRYGKTAFVGNIINFVESRNLGTFATSFGKTISTLEELVKAHQVLLITGNKVSECAREVSIAEKALEEEEERERSGKRYGYEPRELYMMTDYESGERRQGSYEEKEVNDSKIAYREAYSKYTTAEARVVELEAEFRKTLETTTTMLRTMVIEEGIMFEDLPVATEIIQELNREFVNESYDVSSIE